MGYVVILAGGIGSGKTTVSNILRNMGANVFIADEINRDLLQQKDYIDTISNLFPEAVKDGNIEKEILAKIIFSNETARKEVMSIAHPYIYKTMEEKAKKFNLVFLEIPLMPIEIQYNEMWYVVMNKEDRISRIKVRSGYSQQQIEAILKIQEEDVPKDCYLIENNGSIEELELKIKDLYFSLLERF